MHVQCARETEGRRSAYKCAILVPYSEAVKVLLLCKAATATAGAAVPPPLLPEMEGGGSFFSQLWEIRTRVARLLFCERREEDPNR